MRFLFPLLFALLAALPTMGTAQGEETAPVVEDAPPLVVCSFDMWAPVYPSPSSRDDPVVLLPRGYVLPDVEDRQNGWIQLSGEVRDGGYKGWVPEEMASRACTNLPDSIPEPLAFFPLPSLEIPVTKRAYRYGYLSENKEMLSPNMRANAVWQDFSWSHKGCEAVPTFLFTLSDGLSYRSRARGHQECLDNQALQDSVDYEMILLSLDVQTGTKPWTDEQTLIVPWDCHLCHIHHQRLWSEREQRVRYRDAVRERLSYQDAVLQAWLARQ